MRRYILWAIFGLYTLALLNILLFQHPTYLSTGTTYAEHLMERVRLGNYIPFSTITQYATGTPTWPIALRNIVGNVLIFVPFGVLLPLLFNSLYSFKRIALLGLACSFGLEVIQLLMITGSFDVDDVILNTLGVVTGYLCVKFSIFVFAGRRSTEN